MNGCIPVLRASTPSSILFEPMPYGEMQNSPRRTAGSGFGNLNMNNKDSIDINVSHVKGARSYKDTYVHAFFWD